MKHVLSDTSRGAPRLRYALISAALVVAVLGVAWVDGGEEPIRPITQPVELATGAQETDA